MENTSEILQQDQADARSLNIRRTPSFFVNGTPLLDFGYDQLKTLVDEAVAESYYVPIDLLDRN